MAGLAAGAVEPDGGERPICDMRFCSQATAELRAAGDAGPGAAAGDGEGAGTKMPPAFAYGMAVSPEGADVAGPGARP